MACSGCGSGVPRINNDDPLPVHDQETNTWTSRYDPLDPKGAGTHNEHPLMEAVYGAAGDALIDVQVIVSDISVTGTDGSCQPSSSGCEQATACVWAVATTLRFTYSYIFEIANDPGEAGVLSILSSDPAVTQTAMSGSNETTAVTAEVDNVERDDVFALYDVDIYVEHTIDVTVGCGGSGEQSIAFAPDGEGGNFTWTVPAPEGTTIEPSGAAVDEITLQLPCLPCKVAGASVPQASQSASSSPFLQIREGD